MRLGAQTKIAEQIIEQDREYALALKNNQGNLYDEVIVTFAMAEQETFVSVQSSRSERSKKLMAVWKSESIGRSVSQQFWNTSIQRRDGKSSKELG